MSGDTRTVRTDKLHWVMFTKKSGSWASRGNVGENNAEVRAQWVANSQRFLFTTKCDRCNGVMRDDPNFDAGVLKVLEAHKNLHL